MSIDHYYTQIDGRWVRTNMRVVNGEWEYIPDDERPDFRMDFWVDICHGGGSLTDERYYFSDLASALDFYLEGWKDRQYLDDNGNDAGLDHKGLYSRGRLIHGRSIHGDAPGHEGKNLRRICEDLVRKMIDGRYGTLSLADGQERKGLPPCPHAYRSAFPLLVAHRSHSHDADQKVG